jgi:AGCS family alanine or glycine:cation symporter
MKGKFQALLLTVLPLFAMAQESKTGSLDEKINSVFAPIVAFFGKIIFFEPFKFIGFDMPFIVLWLIVGAVFFTFKFNFINFTGLKHSIELIRGVYDDPNEPG